MDTVEVTPQLSMLRVGGWQVYVWRDGDSALDADTVRFGHGEPIVGGAGRHLRDAAARLQD